MPETAPRGYLRENYRLFHIRDQRDLSIDWHFHTFDKAVFFIAGRVRYTVEARSYDLRPGDVLLIRHGRAHRPEIDPGEVYERYILYLDPAYLAACGDPAEALDTCFARAEAQPLDRLRPEAAARTNLLRLLAELDSARHSAAFGHGLLADTLFLQVMIALNRLSLAADADAARAGAEPKIAEIVEYIGANLGEDLSVEALARRFFVSKSFLMHRFPEATGLAPHGYVQLRRLLYAADAIAGGLPAAEACQRAGYNDYSAFSRAFVKKFGVSPGRYRNGAPLEDVEG